MPFRYLMVLLTLATLALPASAQVLYDDLPDAGEFVIEGRKWSNNALKYYFQNGTPDIAGVAEQQAVRDALALWSAASRVSFTEVFTATEADIVVLWASGSHGDPYPFDGPANGQSQTGVVLAHAFYPPPNGGTLAGDLHFDEDETWTLSTRSNSDQPIDLVTVAAHEIGHALGLAHSPVTGALMNKFYTGSHRYLSADDVAGIRTLYGSRQSLAVNHTWPGCTYTAYTTNFSATASGGFPPYVNYTFETKPVCDGGDALAGGGPKKPGGGGSTDAGPTCDWTYASGGPNPYASITRYEPYYVRVRVTDSENVTAYGWEEYIPVAGSCTGGSPQRVPMGLDVLAPNDYAVSAPAPNPFSRETVIRFGLPEAAEVRLAVYDALGREVATLTDGAFGAGWHSARFEAGVLPAGV